MFFVFMYLILQDIIKYTTILCSAVLLKLSDVADRQFFFNVSNIPAVSRGIEFYHCFSFLENIRVPVDDGTRTITGTRTTL